ncbi:hypothetical protein C7401_1484 [Paraburkholderia unamae]|uniref:hypothetical protein n=1 Tax=Paraburkholderia unamae TaxID=219649 RepID=UPI000DC343D7|nr:hypothetical protein [Paraburkholderia unamae]RAR48821.1 hypothetical protein C7401_1484 [Paraburkholderia unamae]
MTDEPAGAAQAPQESKPAGHAAPGGNASTPDRAKDAVGVAASAGEPSPSGAGASAGPVTGLAAGLAAGPAAGPGPAQTRTVGSQDTGFSTAEALSSFRFRVGIDDTLWHAVVGALRKVLGSPATGARTGIIAADERLLGFAAAELFASPDIYIPRDAPPSGIERLSSVTRMHRRPRDFLRKCEDLSAPDGPLFMLAWDAEHIDHASVVSLASACAAPALRHGVICLMLADNARTMGPVDALPVLLNVSERAFEIVVQTIRNLGVEASLDLDEERGLEDLVLNMHRTWSLEAILASLNMPGHAAFIQRAWQSKSPENEQSLAFFRTCVLDGEEDSPREAACLFLVSHFSQLSADQIIELGDELASETPSKQYPSNRVRRFDGITDRILEKCNIRFTPAGRGSPIAELAGTRDRDGETDVDSHRRAAIFQLMFEREAPLLRERYVRHLGHRLAHGHTSNALAKRFMELELGTIRSLIYEDQVAAQERLKRLVYGDLQCQRAPRPGVSESAQLVSHERALARSVERTPALIAELAGASPDDRLLEVIGSLCSPDPMPDVVLPRVLLAESRALLFWHLYTQYPRRITLESYRSLFLARTADDDDARAALVNTLRQHFHSVEKGEGWPIALAGFDSLTMLVGLIDNIVRCFYRIKAEPPTHADVILLTETCAHYLNRAVWGLRWSAVEPWAPAEPGNVAAEQRETSLMHVLSSPYVCAWLNRETPIERSATDTPDDVYAEERTLWYIARQVADAVFACASFGTAEYDALSCWLALQMGLDPNDPRTPPFASGWYWESLVKPDPDPHPWLIRFGAAIRPLLAMLPVVVLMAMTHRTASHPESATAGPGDFVFSGTLRTWLTSREGSQSRAQALLKCVDDCWPLLSNWYRIKKSQFPKVDLDEAKAALDDRVTTLTVFVNCLKALG